MSIGILSRRELQRKYSLGDPWKATAHSPYRLTGFQMLVFLLATRGLQVELLLSFPFAKVFGRFPLFDPSFGARVTRDRKANHALS